MAVLRVEQIFNPKGWVQYDSTGTKYTSSAFHEIEITVYYSILRTVHRVRNRFEHPHRWSEI